MAGITYEQASSLVLGPNASYEAYDAYCSLPGLICVKKNGKNAVLKFDAKDSADYATALAACVKGISVSVLNGKVKKGACEKSTEQSERNIFHWRAIKPTREYVSSSNAFDFFMESLETAYETDDNERTDFVERVYLEQGDWNVSEFSPRRYGKSFFSSLSSSSSSGVGVGLNSNKKAKDFTELQKYFSSKLSTLETDDESLFSELPSVPNAPSFVTTKAFNFDISPVSVFELPTKDLPVNLPSQEETEFSFLSSIDENAVGDFEKIVEMEDDEQPLSKLAKLGKRKEPPSSSI